MLSLDLLPHLEAPPGKILGTPERIDSVTKSGLIVPVGYLTHTRSSIITVHHDSTGRWEPGDRLLLANTAGRRFYVGYTSTEEVEMLVFSPSAVLLKLDETVGKQLGISQDEHWQRNLDGKHEAALEAETDNRWDEGEPDALR